MRISGLALGEFVPGSFVVPQNPVQFGGLGDFVAGSFAVPQNPVLAVPGQSGLGYYPGRRGPNDEWCQARGWSYYNHPIDECEWDGAEAQAGLSGIGCGCGCGGRCGGGMGDVDLSPMGTGIVTSLGTSLGTTLPTIPNWVVYVGGAFVLMAFSEGKRRGGGRR